MLHGLTVSLTEVLALAARYRNRIIVPPYLMQERQSYTRLVSLPMLLRDVKTYILMVSFEFKIGSAVNALCRETYCNVVVGTVTSLIVLTAVVNLALHTNDE